MYHIFCIHSSVEGHLGCFQLLAIINMAAMNIVEHVSLLHVGASSGYMPRSGIAGSSGPIFWLWFYPNRAASSALPPSGRLGRPRIWRQNSVRDFLQYSHTAKGSSCKIHWCLWMQEDFTIFPRTRDTDECEAPSSASVTSALKLWSHLSSLPSFFKCKTLTK